MLWIQQDFPVGVVRHHLQANKSATRQISLFPLSWKKRCETSLEIDMWSAKRRRWSVLFGSLLILGYLWEADTLRIFWSCCQQDHKNDLFHCFTLFFWTRQCVIPPHFSMKRLQNRPPDQSIQFALWNHSEKWPELLLVEVNWSHLKRAHGWFDCISTGDKPSTFCYGSYHNPFLKSLVNKGWCHLFIS